MRGGVLIVQQRAIGDGDHPGVGIDRETTARRVVEAVADGVSTIGIGCQGGHTDRSAVRGVFGDRVRTAIIVGDGADVGLVSVAQIDGEGLCAGRTVARRGLDGDGVRGGGLVVEQ